MVDGHVPNHGWMSVGSSTRSIAVIRTNEWFRWYMVVLMVGELSSPLIYINDKNIGYMKTWLKQNMVSRISLLLGLWSLVIILSGSHSGVGFVSILHLCITSLYDKPFAVCVCWAVNHDPSKNVFFSWLHLWWFLANRTRNHALAPKCRFNRPKVYTGVHDRQVSLR